MADSNTIVPFNKCPSVGEGRASKPILILPVRSWYGGNEWVGTADEIIAASLVTRDQLPGEPGNNKVRATYYRGNLVGKGSSAPYDEDYLAIERYGKTRFIVRKGVSKNEHRRRDTQEILLKKSPDIDFSLLPPALFYIGEKVMVCGACAIVVDIRYDSGDKYNSVGYAYKVDPNLDDQYDWYAEEVLHKYIAKPVSIIALPGAASVPVQQSRRRGRLPKGIASFWDARYERRCRDEKLKELRAELRSLNRSVGFNIKTLSQDKAKLIEVKAQIQELLR